MSLGKCTRMSPDWVVHAAQRRRNLFALACPFFAAKRRRNLFPSPPLAPFCRAVTKEIDMCTQTLFPQKWPYVGQTWPGWGEVVSPLDVLDSS